MHLVLCPDCQRHVRDDASSCPFCGRAASSQDDGSRPGAPVRVARLGRAAIMAFGVAASAASLSACAKEPDNIAQPYGAPPNPTPTPTTTETAPPIVDAAPAPTETTVTPPPPPPQVADASAPKDAAAAPKKDAGAAATTTATATATPIRNMNKPYGAPPIPEDWV